VAVLEVEVGIVQMFHDEVDILCWDIRNFAGEEDLLR